MLAGFTESKIPTKLEDAGGTSWRAVECAEGGAGGRQSEKAEQETHRCRGTVVKPKLQVRGRRAVAMDKISVKGARRSPKPFRFCVWREGHGV